MVSDESRVDDLLSSLEELESMYVQVGILSSASGEMLIIANVHEFGCDIFVTEKMRGFFRYNFGVGLKRSTNVIKIPERSFIRSSFDNKREELMDNEDLLSQVVEGNLSAREFYTMLGEVCVGVIKDYLINEVNSPPNSSLTVANKKSSNPLVDTGRLINSIDYEIKFR